MGKHALGLPRINDIGQMSPEELRTNLSELRRTIMKDKGDTSRGGHPPTGEMRQVRITIARILTVMRKKGISPMVSGDDRGKIPASASGSS